MGLLGNMRKPLVVNKKKNKDLMLMFNNSNGVSTVDTRKNCGCSHTHQENIVTDES